MALGKSIKMYLMLFVATTCVYMVLYQYNINREELASQEQLMKSKLIPAEAAKQAAAANADIATASLVKRYNIFLWSPLSLMSSAGSHSSASTHNSAVASLPLSSMITLAPSLAVASQSTSPPSSSSSSPSTSSSSSSSQSLSPSSLTSLLVLPASSSAALNLQRAPQLAPVKSMKSALASNMTSTQHFVEPLGPLSSVKNTNKTTTTTNTTSTTTTTTTTTTEKSYNKSINNNEMLNMLNKNKSDTHVLNTTTTSKTSSTTTTRATARKIAFVAARTPPPLYIITPTYRRPEQTAELTRLGYTLKHVVNLLWLVIEDANKTSPLVMNTLDRIGVPYEYLVAPMPEEYKNTKKAKPRGVSNRNRGLTWLRKNASEGVFYFADDDNTYDISIFEQMRYTKKVSMWPVGLVTKFGVSSPIIRNGKIDGFYDGWIGGRKYPVDMAGFAVSVKFLHERPEAKMPFKPGYEEDGFLKSLAPLNNTEIELLASNCTEILTWHTQTKKNQAAQPLNLTKYGDTNLVRIDKNLIRT